MQATAGAKFSAALQNVYGTDYVVGPSARTLCKYWTQTNDGQVKDSMGDREDTPGEESYGMCPVCDPYDPRRILVPVT